MPNKMHEICDPIHTFIRLDSAEREVMDSMPFQRLRHVHQLALTYLVYPGATHKRFEHSLGVMELVSRMFDVVTKSPHNNGIREIIPSGDELQYWRRVLRMAALCHDIGHLPFSHSAEKELLFDTDHEGMTVKIIKSDIMKDIWNKMTPPLRSDDIAKLAVGSEKLKKVKFKDWEAILSELIVSNVFGADRMDYLLRDAYYAGVPYGKFDHYRLIDCMRILPRKDSNSNEPALGIESGGLYAAEALLLARYFMFSTVYFHPIRRIYDIHLKDFLKMMFVKGFPIEVNEYLKWTDNEVLTEILKSFNDKNDKKQTLAELIIRRKHYKRLYTINPDDLKLNLNALMLIYDALCKKFGEEYFKKDSNKKEGGEENFPVIGKDQRIVSSLNISQVLKDIPFVKSEYIFASRGLFEEADKWLTLERTNIINKK